MRGHATPLPRWASYGLWGLLALGFVLTLATWLTGGFRFDPAPGTRFDRVGGDELLFEDGRSRGEPYLVLVSQPTRAFGLRITGSLVPDGAERRPANPASDAAAAEGYAMQLAGPRIPRASDSVPARAMAPLLAKGKLVWAPVASGREGPLGFTVGKATYTGEDSWASSYVTIWRQQPDGSWKVLFDTGRAVQKLAP